MKTKPKNIKYYPLKVLAKVESGIEKHLPIKTRLVKQGKYEEASKLREQEIKAYKFLRKELKQYLKVLDMRLSQPKTRVLKFDKELATPQKELTRQLNELCGQVANPTTKEGTKGHWTYNTK